MNLPTSNSFFEKRLAFKGLLRFDQPKAVMEIKILAGWTTVQTEQDALRLARGMVDNSLAACVQVDGPISSTYRWKGTVETSEEWRVTAKFAHDRVKDLKRWLLENHPYEEPQWIVVQAEDVSSAYAEWVWEETRPS